MTTHLVLDLWPLEGLKKRASELCAQFHAPPGTADLLLVPKGFFADTDLDMGKIWQAILEQKNFQCHFAYCCLALAYAEKFGETNQLRTTKQSIAWMKGDLETKKRPGVRIEALHKRVQELETNRKGTS